MIKLDKFTFSVEAIVYITDVYKEKPYFDVCLNTGAILQYPNKLTGYGKTIDEVTEARKKILDAFYEKHGSAIIEIS